MKLHCGSIACQVNENIETNYILVMMSVYCLLFTTCEDRVGDTATAHLFDRTAISFKDLHIVVAASLVGLQLQALNSELDNL